MKKALEDPKVGPVVLTPFFQATFRSFFHCNIFCQLSFWNSPLFPGGILAQAPELHPGNWRDENPSLAIEKSLKLLFKSPIPWNKGHSPFNGVFLCWWVTVTQQAALKSSFMLCLKVHLSFFPSKIHFTGLKKKGGNLNRGHISDWQHFQWRKWLWKILPSETWKKENLSF